MWPFIHSYPQAGAQPCGDRGRRGICTQHRVPCTQALGDAQLTIWGRLATSGGHTPSPCGQLWGQVDVHRHLYTWVWCACASTGLWRDVQARGERRRRASVHNPDRLRRIHPQVSHIRCITGMPSTARPGACPRRDASRSPGLWTQTPRRAVRTGTCTVRTGSTRRRRRRGGAGAALRGRVSRVARSPAAARGLPAVRRRSISRRGAQCRRGVTRSSGDEGGGRVRLARGEPDGGPR